MESKALSLVRETAWSGLAAVMMSAGRLAIAMVLARRLGPAQFGDFVFIQWLVEIIFLLCSFGLTGVGSRFFAEYRSAGSGDFQAFSVWYRQRAIFVVMMAAIVTPTIAYIFSDTKSIFGLIAVSTWAIGNAVLVIATARAQGLQFFKRVAISNLLFVTITFCGVYLLPAQNNAAEVMMMIFAIATLLSSLVCFFAMVPKFSDVFSNVLTFSSSAVSSYATNVWISATISAMVWSRAEISVVRGMLNPTEVALYSTALTLSGLVSMAVALATGALGPKIAHLWGQRLTHEIVELSRTVTDLLIFIGSVAAGLLIVFSSEILTVAFGPKYDGASLVLAVLGIGVMGLSSGCVNTVIQYKTNGRFSRNVNLLGGVLLFSLVIPLVWKFGIIGAAIGRCVAQLVVATITFAYASRHVSKKIINIKNIFWIAFLFSLLFLILTLTGKLEFFKKLTLYFMFLCGLFYFLRIGLNELRLISWCKSNFYYQLKFLK